MPILALVFRGLGLRIKIDLCSLEFHVSVIALGNLDILKVCVRTVKIDGNKGIALSKGAVLNALER